MEACLESSLTTDCYVTGEILLPTGHNIITWRSFNTTRTAQENTRSRKSLHCEGGVLLGSYDAVNDTAVMTWDFSEMKGLNPEISVNGCVLAGNEDLEPVLRFEHTTGVSASIHVSIYFNNVSFGQSDNYARASYITTTSTFASRVLSFEKCWFTRGSANVNSRPTFHYLGGFPPTSSQGNSGRLIFSNTVFQTEGNGSGYALWESVGDVGGVLDVAIINSSITVGIGTLGAASDVLTFIPAQESSLFLFGTADAVNVDINNTLIFVRSASITPEVGSLFSWAYTGAVKTYLKGRFTLRTDDNAYIGSIYNIAGAGKGPMHVDLAVDLVGATGSLDHIAIADTGSTVNARRLDVSVTGRQNLPSGVDFPSIFDRTMMDKLASEAIANGTLTLNGKPIYVVNGMIGSRSFTDSYLFARTLNAVASGSDTSLYTVPATPTPLVITKASCVTEDTTGAATFQLWRGAIGTPLAAAAQACSFRQTTAVASDCTGPSCTAGVEKTATLTSTPDLSSVTCSSSTPATSFQLDGAGYVRNRVNIDYAYNNGANTIIWVPTATVSADLTCTYQTVPVWHTQGNGNNVFDTAAQLLGFRATAATFGGIGKTRIMIEATPAF
jgi:hypothetical protein